MTVYIYQINPLSHSLELFQNILSEKEWERASNYKFKRDRHRFIATRGSLRVLLSRELNVDPKRIEIFSNPFGKPEVKGMHFNVSYSHEKSLIAISSYGPIGIDIECCHPKVWSKSAEDFLFSDAEKSHSSILLENERKKYFLSVWTKKEAWVKAMGIGLTDHLNRLDTEDLQCEWTFHPLQLEDPYIAHLATTREEANVRCCNYCL
ncbi:MAG: 4'-phosphopantetheinyl transferase superfamily protein [Simkaniaceae bacterium]|nr:4'-phosphopantetheinyl transferase superfamily protein [Simkaniaceae bacterium]